MSANLLALVVALIVTNSLGYGLRNRVAGAFLVAAGIGLALARR